MKKVFLCISLLICHTIYSFQATIEKSAETKEAYENFTFAWTAVFGDSSKNHYEVDVLHQGQKTQLKIFAVTEDQKKLISQTYITKDVWYVIEGDRKTKYRPFEAHYELAQTYQYLMKSKLQFINNQNVRFLGKYSGLQDQQHQFYIPLSEAEKEAIRRKVDYLRTKLIPNSQSRSEENYYLSEAKKLLQYAKEGKLNTVNQAGVITRLDNPDGAVEIINLRWITIANPTALEPVGEFTDLTTKPILNESVFFSYNGIWKPGQTIFNKDARYINYESGEIRRIPFKGVTCTPQAIDRQNSTIYITGRTPASSAIAPFTINFLTGQMRPIGPRSLHSGKVSQIALSHDKKKLAILHNPQPHLANINQLVIIDLNTRVMNTYSPNQSPSRISWHPDNQSIYFSDNSAEPKIHLYSPGKMTNEIIVGHYPVTDFINNRLLFLDPQDQLWKSSSLDGQDLMLFQDGLSKLQFPSIIDDSKAAFILQDEDNYPVPVIYHFDKQESQKLSELKGLWLTPVWN